jgi:hypothetical protein
MGKQKEQVLVKQKNRNGEVEEEEIGEAEEDGIGEAKGLELVNPREGASQAREPGIGDW